MPVIAKDLLSSVDLQIKVNTALANKWEEICGRKHREIGLLYSLHIAPNALDESHLLREAILGMSDVISKEDIRHWGIHIHFTDIKQASYKPHRINNAKDLVRNASQIAGKYNGFATVSDAGPVGIAFLDLGASYTSYYTAMTPRKIFQKMRYSEEANFGKVLGLWQYNLHSREDVRRRNDVMDDTGLFQNTVPISAQGDRCWKLYRVEFGKPYNVSVMEKLNILRTAELT